MAGRSPRIPPNPTENDAWLIRVLDEAESKPESAHQALTSALASETSSAERMLWWLAHAPKTSDAIDALSDAWSISEVPRTRLLLAIALALFNYADSCPVELGSDGACHDPRYPPLDELVPEPGARATTMHAIGVTSLEFETAPH